MDFIERLKDFLNPEWHHSNVEETDCEVCGEEPCECEEEDNG